MYMRAYDTRDGSRFLVTCAVEPRLILGPARLAIHPRTPPRRVSGALDPAGVSATESKELGVLVCYPTGQCSVRRNAHNA